MECPLAVWRLDACPHGKLSSCVDGSYGRHPLHLPPTSVQENFDWEISQKAMDQVKQLLDAGTLEVDVPFKVCPDGVIVPHAVAPPAIGVAPAAAVVQAPASPGGQLPQNVSKALSLQTVKASPRRFSQRDPN